MRKVLERACSLEKGSEGETLAHGVPTLMKRSVISIVGYYAY